MAGELIRSNSSENLNELVKKSAAQPKTLVKEQARQRSNSIKFEESPANITRRSSSERRQSLRNTGKPSNLSKLQTIHNENEVTDPQKVLKSGFMHIQWPTKSKKPAWKSQWVELSSEELRAMDRKGASAKKTTTLRVENFKKIQIAAATSFTGRAGAAGGTVIDIDIASDDAQKSRILVEATSLEDAQSWVKFVSALQPPQFEDQTQHFHRHGFRQESKSEHVTARSTSDGVGQIENSNSPAGSVPRRASGHQLHGGTLTREINEIIIPNSLAEARASITQMQAESTSTKFKDKVKSVMKMQKITTALKRANSVVVSPKATGGNKGKLAQSTLPAFDEEQEDPLQEAYDRFLEANDIWDILALFEDVLILADVGLDGGPNFFELLQRKLSLELNFKQNHFFRTIRQRLKRIHEISECKKLTGVQCVITGAGPVGLRAAVEFALMGADVTVMEMRNAFPRLNILHLWDWACDDLADLGFTRAELFGPGGNNHISTRTLQTNLTKLACLLGVRIYTGVKFAAVEAPSSKGGLHRIKSQFVDTDGFNDRCGRQLEANILIDAGGTAAPVVKYYDMLQKKQKLSKALGLVAHFKRSKGENSTREFSHAYQYKQKEFDTLKSNGIDIENVVHYKRGTHYLVMTPTVGSLIAKQCFKAKKKSTTELLQASNLNKDKLREYAREVAIFWGLPKNCEFIADERQAAQIFDFSERTTTEQPMHVVQSGNSQLLVFVAGDALIEPFWPEGLGINRGFFSVMDTAYVVQSYFHEGYVDPALIKEMTKLRDILFKIQSGLSGHTKMNVLLDESSHKYSFVPDTRYKTYRRPQITQGNSGAHTHTVSTERTITRDIRLQSAKDTTRIPSPVTMEGNKEPMRQRAKSERKKTSSSSTKCEVCKQTVYAMEKITADGKNYHKSCFKCQVCEMKVSAGSYAAAEGNIFCKPHFKQLFLSKGNYSDGFGKEQHKKQWASQRSSTGSPVSESGTVIVSVQSPFGLLLDGTAKGCFVATLKEGKSLAKTGLVKEGMRITAVNDDPVKGMDKAKITQLIKKSGSNCKFEFEEDPKGYAAFKSTAKPQTTQNVPPPKPSRHSNRSSTGSNVSNGDAYSNVRSGLRASSRRPSIETAE